MNINLKPKNCKLKKLLIYFVILRHKSALQYFLLKQIVYKTTCFEYFQLSQVYLHSIMLKQSVAY